MTNMEVKYLLKFWIYEKNANITVGNKYVLKNA